MPRQIPKAALPEIKLEPSEPQMHPYYKEHIRDFLDSRSSSTSAHRLHQQESRHSGYVTDTSSSMWQFNGSSSFSPRSLVTVNVPAPADGDVDGMLLRVRTSMGAGTSSSASHASTSSQPQPPQRQLLRNGHVTTTTRTTATNGSRHATKERAIVKVEAPPPIVRRSPVRREVVEVRREVVKAAPTIKHTVHRVEEKKRTEEVERRVIRKERRHKSRRMHRSHHSSSGGGAHQEYQYGSWGGGSRGGGGYRSSSASRASRGAYMNGYGSHAAMEHHLPITYEGGGGTRSVRSGGGGGGFDSSSDRYYAGGGGGGGGGRQQNGFAHQQQHARYGSLSDSLRHGDLKYAPNGEVRQNGTAAGGAANVKAHRVHKAHSTRDVFYRDSDGGAAAMNGGGGGGGTHYSAFNRRAEPFVEFPPTLDRRSDWGPEPPPHRRAAGAAAADEYSSGGGAAGGGIHALQKARSYTDWEEGTPRRGGGGGGPIVGHANVYDDDMARLESEFRDARLMRIPGNMDEKQQYHREIPGGYETYSRETKAHADHRKLDGGDHAAHPGDFRRESQRP
ncbi:hypothetical protein niasHS_006050 [Heterodera schachtii]|uniref:Uncharacterized protein n=1 Tax=Heterodera schachtii TaxID=97005 RepID=A0ABD2JVS4_HETSC